jgi:hypothetical protein
MNANSRDFNRLHPKVEHGSFNNQGVVPTFTPDREAKAYDEKIALKKKAYEFFSDRYDSKNPIAVR